jgi:hypothetical protein
LVENTYFDERRDLVYFLRSPETMAIQEAQQENLGSEVNAQANRNDAQPEE